MSKTSNSYGMDITKLKRNKEITVIKRIEQFLKNNSKKAYRTMEIENIFKEYSIYSIRSAVRKLFTENKIKRKQIFNNKSYYYWNKDEEQRINKLNKSWGTSHQPTKVSFIKGKFIKGKTK